MTKMFSLSPREDLILITTRHNYPEFSWEQISEIILITYNFFIPSDICCERYEHFLKKINIKQPQISPPSRFQWSTIIKTQTQIKINQKIPQNFIFAYRELKSKASDLNKEIISLNCLQNYEKRAISKLFGINNNQKQKIIKKVQNNHKKDKDNGQFIDSLHSLIKQRTEGVLTQEIIEQKMEQILSEIIESVNQRIQRIQKDKFEMISNPLELIRNMKKYFMFGERKKIFDIYLEQQEINDLNYSSIKSIFKYIQMTTIYSHDKEQGKPECIIGQQQKQTKEITNQIKIDQQKLQIVKQVKQQTQQYPEINQTKEINFQDKEDKMKIQLFQSFNLKHFIQQIVQQCEEIKLQNKQQINQNLSYQTQPQKAPQIQHQQKNMLSEKQPTFFSTFQVTIKDAKVQIQSQNQEIQYNQQKIKEQVKQQELIKEQQDAIKLKDNPKRKRHRLRKKNKNIPISIGKVWLIIND